MVKVINSSESQIDGTPTPCNKKACAVSAGMLAVLSVTIRIAMLYSRTGEALNHRSQHLHILLEDGDIGDTVLLASCQQIFADLIHRANQHIRNLHHHLSTPSPLARHARHNKF